MNVCILFRGLGSADALSLHFQMCFLDCRLILGLVGLYLGLHWPIYLGSTLYILKRNVASNSIPKSQFLFASFLDLHFLGQKSVLGIKHKQQEPLLRRTLTSVKLKGTALVSVSDMRILHKSILPSCCQNKMLPKVSQWVLFGLKGGRQSHILLLISGAALV